MNSSSSTMQNIVKAICFWFVALFRSFGERRHNIFVAVTVLLFLSMILVLAQGTRGYADTPANYHTEEYYSNTADPEQIKDFGGNLGYINADIAYALGYTGYNVTVGIIDTYYFLNHPEFIANVNLGGYRPDPTGNEPDPKYFIPDDKNDKEHGVHVAGIIAAAKDDKMMHGVAYDASYYAISNYSRSDSLLAFIGKNDVKVINNSWNYKWSSADSNLADYNSSFTPWGFMNEIDSLVKARDVLLVFSAGNDGRSSPAFPASYPTIINGGYLYDGTYIDPLYLTIQNNFNWYKYSAELNFDENNIENYGNNWKNNIISVSSFNHRFDTDSIMFISPFSNLADGASGYSLLAPGQDIYSTIPYELESGENISDPEILDKFYAESSGTSMSAPHVTGVAALVQQAFPYLQGKQIGDILLSTARKLTIDAGELPPFIIMFDKIKDQVNNKVLVYTYKGKSEIQDFSTTYKTQIADYIDTYNKTYRSWFNSADDDLETAIKKAISIGNIIELTKEQYEGLFGQGIVDAGKAVWGPGYFDASRLDPVSDALGFKDVPWVREALMYKVNTLHYDSFWGNDIGEENLYYDSSRGVDLPVGLEKSGSGTLVLAGQNTFSGPTLVKEGSIALKDGKISGRLEVADNASFQGYGTVAGNAVVEGTLNPSGDTAADYGQLTFQSGLILTETAQVYFDLGEGLQGQPLSPGRDYDSITVSGGAFTVGGTWHIDTSYAGTYVLFEFLNITNADIFDLDYASGNKVIYSWAGASSLYLDSYANNITLILSMLPGQTSYFWAGTGDDNSEWTLDKGKWTDGTYYVNKPGNLLTFRGAGESIVLTDTANPMHFDTMLFSSDGYVITSQGHAKLQADPYAYVGTIIVTGDNVARVEANIISGGYSLNKKGTGTLVLGALGEYGSGGGSSFDGQFTVAEGKLVLWTDRTFASLEGGLTVEAGAELIGTARVDGPVVINGVLSPGTDKDYGTEYGKFVFYGGLTLGSSATVKFDLDHFMDPGITSDLVEVRDGELKLAGTLDVTAWASGTYVIFDYKNATAIYSGSIDTALQVNHKSNGQDFSSAVLYDDTVNSLITLTLARTGQNAYTWLGKSSNINAWDEDFNSFINGDNYDLTASGNVYSFVGDGHDITVRDDIKFNTFLFGSNGYNFSFVTSGRFIYDENEITNGIIHVFDGVFVEFETAIIARSTLNNPLTIEKTGGGDLHLVVPQLLDRRNDFYNTNIILKEGYIKATNGNLGQGNFIINEGTGLQTFGIDEVSGLSGSGDVYIGSSLVIRPIFSGEYGFAGNIYNTYLDEPNAGVLEIVANDLDYSYKLDGTNTHNATIISGENATLIVNSESASKILAMIDGATIRFDQPFDGTYDGEILDDEILAHYDERLVKAMAGELTLAHDAVHSGGTSVIGGTLRLDSINLGDWYGIDGVTVSEGAALSGKGKVNGTSRIEGTLSPGGTNPTDYGELIFDGYYESNQGLTLTDTARVIFYLGSPNQAGIDYDTITVSSGTLILGGTLEVSALSAGIYTLFNYNFDFANYSPLDSIENEFHTKIFLLNDNFANGVLDNDDINKIITLTIGTSNQINRLWKGTNFYTTWNDDTGKWDNGPTWKNQPGNVLTFADDYDIITVGGSYKDFDTLYFKTDGYVLQGGALNISPGSGNVGVINVEDGLEAIVYTPIAGPGQGLIKTGDGRLVFGDVNTYTGGTTVHAGTLLLASGSSLSYGQVSVENGATLAGFGTAVGKTTVHGTLSAGGTQDGDYGMLTFANGLVLTEGSEIIFDLGHGDTAGVNYDSVTVSGGDLVLAGTINVSALSAGTYKLFSYYGADYSPDGDVEDDFQTKIFKLNDSQVNGTLINNAVSKIITLTIGTYNQTNRQWDGTGVLAYWTDENGKWADGETWSNRAGNVLTFTGPDGDRITLQGSDKEFDTLYFSVPGYTLMGGTLKINPALDGEGFGRINVADTVTATVRTPITGEGISLSKVGGGTLVLGGDNAYDGGTTVSGGSLLLEKTGSLASGQLTVESGAVLGGDGVVNGEAVIRGTLSPGGISDDIGVLTFAGGLTLEETARIIFQLETASMPGTFYDTVVVSAGTLALGGILDVTAESAGVYTLFSYAGAIYSPILDIDINEAFSEKNIFLDGKSAKGILNHDDVSQIITLTVSASDKTYYGWLGTGKSATWSDSEGEFTDGASWTNRSGNVVTFDGTGDTVTLSGLSKDFDTLMFLGDGFHLHGTGLMIEPDHDEHGVTGRITVGDNLTATVDSAIHGTGKQLEKAGQGTLVLGGTNTYTGGTLVNDGTLLLDDGVLAEGALKVKGDGTLAGNGAVHGPAVVEGKISVGVSDDDYGMLTFLDGLTLADAASLVFHLGNAGTAGADYDSIRVSGGDLILEDTLKVLAYAVSAGTYTLFNYDGAGYQGNIETDFAKVTAFLDGLEANGTLANSMIDSVITLTVSLGDQHVFTHTGDGNGSVLDLSGNDDTGNVITFTGIGETVVVAGGGTHFDTLRFESVDYVLTGSDLEIDPASGHSGAINVDSSKTATVGNAIRGSGKTLRKVGDGTLVLTGENDYDGGTRVEGGTLKGNIRDDTDLSVLAGAVYDGADQARSVAVLDGGGTIKNTDGLAVASGNFSGNIDSSNDGGLIKDGNGVLILSGNNQYGGGTTVADGTLKGNITEGTDLTIASTAVYHGDDKARTVGKLNGEGSVRNTAGMTVSSGDFSGSIDSSNVGGLTKETGGELILSGNNQYAGETKVAGGTLKGNIASGTDLTIASGAAYHGNDQARKVSKLDGEGTVRHTDGLTVSSGTFSGSIDGSNEGGLTKESGGELVLSGQNEYKGSTTITAGRLTGNIAEGTDLAIASAGVYDGAQAERTVSSLSGFGSIVNTVGLIVSSGTFGGNIDDTNTGGLTKVDDGDLYLTGDNSYAGGTVISGGSLIGDSASLKGDIANGAVLAFVQNEDRTFEGNITGSGDILKLGIGALVFDSDQSAGQVEISGGSLIVGGSVSQSAVKLQADTVNVNANAILGGHGTIESNVVVHEGGLLSPGNSYGKHTITGNLEFKPDSVFEIEVNPLDPSDSDIAIVRGIATLAGTFRHVATSLNADDYLKTDNEWLILDAAAMSGKFDAEESTLAFLLPHLRYDYSAADVFLSFTSRGATFGDYANTRNGRSVAAALESLDYGSELYRQIVSSATTDQAPGLLDDLSGEMHGAVTSGLFGIGRGFANMLSRHVAGLSRVGSGYQAPAAGSPGEGGNSFWAVASGTHTVLRGTAETARTTMVGPEVSVGYDHSFDNGWLAGLAFQYGHKKVKTGARHSEAEVDSLTVGVYGGREIRLGPGLLRLVLSGAYSHHDVDSTRKVTIGTQTQTLDASYTARSIEGSLEAAYRFPVSDSFHLEPYVSIGMQRLRLGGFSETGGSAALTSVARSWNHAVSTAGLRLLLAANDRVSFGANLGWQHTFGNLVSTATYAFREGGRGFTVNSSPMNRNEALVGLDLGVKVSDNVNLSLGYNGSLGNQGQSHGGMAMVEVKW